MLVPTRNLRLHLLIAGLLVSQVSWADSATEASPVSNLQQAAQWRREAEDLRVFAEGAYEAAKIDCQHAFLVNACLSQAREHYVDQVSLARQLTEQAYALELEYKNQQASDKKLQQQQALSTKTKQRNERESSASESSQPQTLSPAEKEAQIAHTLAQRQQHATAIKARRDQQAQAAAKRAAQARADKAAYEARQAERSRQIKHQADTSRLP